MAKPNKISKPELLVSAKQCIIERGLENVTLKAVADGAGVTQGTVYYHFRTKEQLLAEVTESIIEESWAAMASLEDGPDKWRAMLEQVKQRCTQESVYQKLFFSILFAGFSNPSISNQIGTMLDKENRYLTDDLAKADMNLDGIPLSPQVLSILINALFDGLAIQALTNDKFDRELVFAEINRLAEHLIKKEDKR